MALSIRHFIHTHSSAKIFPKSHNVLIEACFITGAITSTSKLFSILGRNAVIFKSMIEDPTHGPVVNATLEKAKIIGKSYNQGITTVVNAVHDHQGKKTKPPFLPKNILDMITRREIKSPTSPKCDIVTIMSKYHEIQTPLSTLSLESNYKQFREKWIVTNMNKSTPLKHNEIVLLEEKAMEKINQNQAIEKLDQNHVLKTSNVELLKKEMPQLQSLAKVIGLTLKEKSLEHFQHKAENRAKKLLPLKVAEQSTTPAKLLVVSSSIQILLNTNLSKQELSIGESILLHCVHSSLLENPDFGKEGKFNNFFSSMAGHLFRNDNLLPVIFKLKENSPIPIQTHICLPVHKDVFWNFHFKHMFTEGTRKKQKVKKVAPPTTQMKAITKKLKTNPGSSGATTPEKDRPSRNAKSPTRYGFASE